MGSPPPLPQGQLNSSGSVPPSGVATPERLGCSNPRINASQRSPAYECGVPAVDPPTGVVGDDDTDVIADSESDGSGGQQQHLSSSVIFRNRGRPKAASSAVPSPGHGGAGGSRGAICVCGPGDTFPRSCGMSPEGVHGSGGSSSCSDIPPTQKQQTTPTSVRSRAVRSTEGGHGSEEGHRGSQPQRPTAATPSPRTPQSARRLDIDGTGSDCPPVAVVRLVLSSY
jgi:hypothetical protein